MFIDFTGAQGTLRQEGNVCDPTECMSPGRQTWPSCRRAASLVTALYKHDPPDGGRCRSAQVPLLITPGGRS